MESITVMVAMDGSIALTSCSSSNSVHCNDVTTCMCHLSEVGDTSIYVSIPYHRFLRRNESHKLSSTSKQRRGHWQMCSSSLDRQVGQSFMMGCHRHTNIYYV